MAKLNIKKIRYRNTSSNSVKNVSVGQTTGRVKKKNFLLPSSGFKMWEAKVRT